MQPWDAINGAIDHLSEQEMRAHLVPNDARRAHLVASVAGDQVCEDSDLSDNVSLL